MTDRKLDAQAALEEAIGPALRRGRCLVAFSGGRDSSLLLAAAASYARREGLEPPVPATLRFPGATGTDESDWQERVVRHLDLQDWHRRDLSDELDFIGPVAGRVLREHGVLFPANVHFFVPLLETAGHGATLLTGTGGDHLFGTWAWGPVFDVLARRRRPRPRDAVSVAHLAAPWALRGRVFRRSAAGYVPGWLRPAAREQTLASWEAEERTKPRRWDRWVTWLARRRIFEVTRASFDRVGATLGWRIEHPLLDTRFFAAVARTGGATGWLDRTAAMTALFSDLLPAEVLSRRTKAVFDDPLWGPASRDFISRWNGEGVDPAVVDPEALAAAWRQPSPNARTSLLLQSAWLAEEDSSTARLP